MTNPTPPIGIEDAAQQLIAQTLAADPAISSDARGVYLDEQPRDQATPHLIVALLSAEDVHTFAERAFTSLLVEVRAVVDQRSTGTPRLAVELAEHARTILDAGISDTSVHVRGLRRVQRIAREEWLDGGIRRVHRGGIYAVLAQHVGDVHE